MHSDRQISYDLHLLKRLLEHVLILINILVELALFAHELQLGGLVHDEQEVTVSIVVLDLLAAHRNQNYPVSTVATLLCHRVESLPLFIKVEFTARHNVDHA